MRSRLRASTTSRMGWLAVAMLLGACTGAPLPADKLDYAGHWRGPGVDLVIGLDGKVSYERGAGSGRVQIQGPIQGFVGDDFIVGVMVVKTTFDVTAPPVEKNGIFTMTVDGIELTRGP